MGRWARFPNRKKKGAGSGGGRGSGPVGVGVRGGVGESPRGGEFRQKADLGCWEAADFDYRTCQSVWAPNLMALVGGRVGAGNGVGRGLGEGRG